MSEWLSNYILIGTSAQLGYTVPFTLVHAGKYRTENELKTDTLQTLNTTQNKKAQLMLAYPRDAKTMKKIPPFQSYNKFQSSRKSSVYSN